MWNTKSHSHRPVIDHSPPILFTPAKWETASRFDRNPAARVVPAPADYGREFQFGHGAGTIALETAACRVVIGTEATEEDALMSAEDNAAIARLGPSCLAAA